eukprot:1291172-Pleurochrysis_carterae.AAC.2
MLVQSTSPFAPSPCCANTRRRTCMHLAASSGNLHVLAELIKSRGNVNIRDRWGGTPLYDAVREGHLHCAELLRDSGAELMLDESAASSLLCEYARLGDLEKIRLLLSCGIDVNAKDYDHR